MRLKNKVAVITGGNSGIGLGIAQEFKNEGAKGTIVGRNPNKMEKALEILGDSFIGIKADVTNNTELENLFATTVENFGKLDVVVVNAGGAIGEGSLSTVQEASELDYDRMMDLNLKSVFFTVQKALPYLKDGASIILVASIAIHKGMPGLTVYSAAKAGVRSFARTFSKDLLDRKIRVNVLSPGTIDTPLFENLGIPEEHSVHAKQSFTELIPIGRIGQPSDTGKVAVFLASDDSKFLLGEEIIADGGVVNL